jgi:hypothetical protein
MARHEKPQSDPVVAAIERVLEAERDGVQLLRASRDNAERLLGEARAQAAAIARRADACITKLHTAYLQKIQRDIEAAAGADPAAGADSDRAFDRAVLEAAARRVAAKLTGGA